MREDEIKKGKIVSDILLSILSSSLPIVLLQLVILPMVSRQMDGDRYGLLVTVISYISVLPSAMGNVINNIRLLKNNDYLEQKLEGDFNVLLLGSLVINIAATLIFGIVYKLYVSVPVWLLVFLLSILVSAYEYYIVTFRLVLDYKSTLISNVFLSVGYFAGLFAFQATGLWPLVYITGYTFALVYIFAKSRLWKEKICITDLFRGTFAESATLFAAGLLSRLISYADKLLIYPILGGEDVAVYYAASVIGKIISMMISPISNVILSYLAKMKKRRNNIFYLVLAITGTVGIIGYFVCLAASRFILQLLYPQYMETAMSYIPITTATAIIAAMIGIMNPFVLKFVAMKWQIIINGLTLAAYVAMALGFLAVWGMVGFCRGVLLANLIKFILILVIYILKSRKKELPAES